MAPATIDSTLQRLRSKAKSSPHIASALEFLADDDETHDPFGEVDEGAVVAVRAINRRRLEQQRDALRRRALTTAQVVQLVESISDRKAVDRRRQRGRLLGVKDGRTVLHPAWQFDTDVGDSRRGLDRVLAALRELTSSSSAADAVMTAVRPDLGNRSLADVFADGDVELAVRLIAMAGDQS